MTPIKNARRSGTTTVEFAIVAPLVFLFFFAAIEYARMTMIRHGTELAAYEGARRGIVPGATVADIVTCANRVLATVGARNATVVVSPSPITAQASHITVDIQVPLDDNGWIAPHFLSGQNLQRAFTLRRENVAW
jgi:Flp pilus assembly protein TadG